MQIEKLLNERDNAKNIWTHAWICMHDADNEIVNSQANMTKANQYSLWHEVYETTGYDARNATYKNGTFIAEDGTDLLALFKEKSKNGAGYELYSKRSGTNEADNTQIVSEMYEVFAKENAMTLMRH